MRRGFWSGSIRFGLVNIPVSLKPAAESVDLDFDLVDVRDFAPIGYKKFNKTTGRDVPPDKIVKTFKVDEGEAVIVTDEDFARARPEDPHAFVIDAFVESAEIRPVFFDTPYLLEPVGKDAHAYVLLRTTLEKTGRTAIAKGVLRTRERLAAIYPDGDFLVLNTLRFAHELRPRELPQTMKKAAKLNPAELKMAEALIQQMDQGWDPAAYHDEYREQLLAYIEKKAKAGEARKIYAPEEAPAAAQAPRGDLMSLLKASVKRDGDRHARRRSRTA
ncbi:MAG: Ku protein [Planctomycetaceae bacterium]|nr:Ku protein [Planctomycetaceae bacterium]